MNALLTTFLLYCLISSATAGVTQGLHYVVRYGVRPDELNYQLHTEDSSILLTSLTPGITYYATVTAVSPEGVESPPSSLMAYQVPFTQEAEEVLEIQTSDDLTVWKTEIYLPQPEGTKARYLRIRPRKLTSP